MHERKRPSFEKSLLSQETFLKIWAYDWVGPQEQGWGHSFPSREQHHARGLHRNIIRVSMQTNMLGNAWKVGQQHSQWRDAGDTLLGSCSYSQEQQAACAKLLFWGCLRKHFCCCQGWRASPVFVWQMLHISGISRLLCGVVWLLFPFWKGSTFILSGIFACSRSMLRHCLGIDLTLIKQWSGGRKYIQSEVLSAKSFLESHQAHLSVEY